MHRSSHSAEETITQGRALAALLEPPRLVLLSGELGAGKTTLAKGIIAGLGAAREEDVLSPTFTLVHLFQRKEPEALKVYHIDLYRIEGRQDLETLGLEDVFDEPAVVLVEWPDRLTALGGMNEWPITRIQIAQGADGTRSLEIEES